MSNFTNIGPPQPGGFQPPPPVGFNMQYGNPQQPPYAYQAMPQQPFGPPGMHGYGAPPQHPPPPGQR